MSRTPSTSTDAIIVDNLSKTFRSNWTLAPKQVVKNLSFRVAAGECFGFVGPNGAGKTTTIKMLLDLIRPTSGSVLLFGQPASSAAARARVGFLPERPYFYDHMNAREILAMYAAVAGCPTTGMHERVDATLRQVGLDAANKTALNKYSKGMLQRIGLAQAIVADPDLLILDEPMSGLDPIGRREVRDLIQHQKALGRTVFFSSHILNDVESICDRVVMLHQGKVVSEGRVSMLLERAGRGETEIVVSSERPPAGSEKMGDYFLIRVPHTQTQKKIAELMAISATIISVTPRHGTLEDEFMRSVASPSNAANTPAEVAQ